MFTLIEDESPDKILCQCDFETILRCEAEEMIEDESPDKIVCQCDFETILRCETEDLLAG